MSFFDGVRRWFRQLHGIPEPFHTIERPDGSKAVVDATTKDYLFGSGPAPSQASLDAALRKATSLRVFDDGAADGRPFSDEVLFETDDPGDLAELAATLRIVEDPSTFGHCMCHGSLALEFRKGTRRVAVIGLHHGQSIRWNKWRHDAHLVDGEALADWLLDHGVPDLRQEIDRTKRMLEADALALERWEAAIPDPLREPWESYREEILSNFRVVHLEQFRETLHRELPDTGDRVRAVLRWFGSGRGQWSGYPAYEALAEELLLETETTEVLSAVELSALEADPVLAEGLARYLGGWSFRTKRAGDINLVEPHLARALREHVERRTDDKDRLERARLAFP